jgi:hypothetical protein
MLLDTSFPASLLMATHQALCLAHVCRLQDENLQLEKARADLTLDLKRATSAKEASDAVAKAANQRLQDVLAELDDAKHSSEAASTTSQCVRKVRLHCNAGRMCSSLS